MSAFLSALRSGKVLLMDGAMGTELERLGNRPPKPPPRAAASVHSAYTASGADVILTNTFQAHHHEHWQTAIESARRAKPKPRFILGAIGPIEKPTKASAAAIFAECQGLDGVLLETWTSLGALKIFAKARPRALPLLISFTFLHGPGDELLTFEGKPPEACGRAAKKCGAVALGANCGKEIDMGDMREIVARYRGVCELPIFVRPNAGTPKRTRSGWKYPRSPAGMAARLPALLEAGVAMVGGCCGTTPAHIRAFRGVVDAWNNRAARGGR
jgi:5-methyltetrahydrofolate--homocysteine methyltransferase